MPLQKSYGEAPQTFATGPVTQYLPNLSAPATVGATSTWTSAVQVADGFKNLGVGATLSTAGNLIVNRYLDLAGTILNGPATTVAITAGTPAVAIITDGKPMASYTVQVQNTAAGVGNLTNFVVLQDAQ